MMSIPLFDCHCDTITQAQEMHENMRANSLHIDFTRLSEFSPAAQVFAVCAVDDPQPERFAAEAIAFFKSQINENQDAVKLCLSFQDILAAADEGKIAALLSVEGAEQMPDIDKAYDAGVRIVHLTWNHDNELCGAAMDSGAGLTAKGESYVRRAQDIGVLLDMSHISERGFWDVLEHSRRPIIAGHSNAKTVCNVPRNLSNAQFEALVKLGGGAGINMYPEFLGLGYDLDAVFAHIEHFMSLGGEKAVFLGCDFDGIEETPRGLGGVQDLRKLYELLLQRNYPEDLVRDIFRGNIMRIMEAAL